MLERSREEPVCEPRVTWQQRPVQIRPDRPIDPNALETALPVVAEPCDDPSQRHGARIEPRHPRVVLEARQRLPHARLELALQQAVADHPPLARHRLVRKKARAGQLLSVSTAIDPAQELVAAAHGTHRHTSSDRLPDRFLPRSEIWSDQRLLAILAAPDVQQVVLAGPQLVAEADRLDLEADPTPARTARQDRDVPAIRVAVQVLRIEVGDPARHAARSQYGCTNPRSATIRRSASIAVYVGRTTSSPPPGDSSSPRSSAASSSGTTSIASAEKPPYLQRSAISAARSPVTTTRPSPASSGSQSTSQIHETSRPSAIASFSASTASLGAPPATSVRTASFAPAGFFTSSTSRRLSPIGIRSKRPNAAPKRSSPAAASSSVDPRAVASEAAASAL